MSVLEKIILHANTAPSSPAFLSKNFSKTYKQFLADISSSAAKLIKAGVSKGHKVVIKARNDYDYICVYFATHYIGAISVPIAVDITDSFKIKILDELKPKLVIDDCSHFISSSHDVKSEMEDLVLNIEENNLSDIVFTSGTTGDQKGVPLSHKQISLVTEHIINNVKNSSDDVELLLMPLSHSFGMARLRSVLYVGGSLVIGYPLQRLKGVFNAIEFHGVTGLGIVPSAWRFITKISKNKIQKYSEQLRYIELGSALLHAEEKLELTKLLPKTHIVIHYGSTEVSRAIFSFLKEDKHTSTANLSRGAKVQILDTKNNPLPDGELGEIALKTPWMFSGYYKNTSLSKLSIINGFFKTGDQGYIRNNYLFLTGRINEIINVGGKKFSPYSIEEILNEFDCVAESACVGYPDSEMGEIVHAYIVLTEKNHKDISHKLHELASSKLPVYMRPEKYIFCKSLPKTSSGKIKRTKLKEPY